MRKFSKQREMILQYLQEKRNHPTAEQIYTELKSQLPSLSLATVYRNLNLLCSLDKVQRLDTGESGDRFDATMQNHAHFICEVCQSVTDIPAGAHLQEQTEKILEEGYQITRHKLFVYGTCPHCQNSSVKEIC